MISKITNISERPKKHHSPWFVNKYSREVRELNNLSPNNIPDDKKKFYPPAEEKICYGVTDESPFNGNYYYKEMDLEDGVMNFNPLLIYRLLRLMYGFPDIVGGFIDNSKPDETKVMIGDWSYILRLDKLIVAEIRSMFTNTRHIVRFWTDTISGEEPLKGKGGPVISEFGKDLNKAVSRNLHLFKEQEELRKATGKAFLNSFAAKYKSAERLFELAQVIEEKPDKITLQWGEHPEAKTIGSIYMASVLFYIIAIDTLLNILYKIFLHPDYNKRMYERVTTHKADLEIRLSTIHFFCTCFSQQVISPKSESWEDMELLREFRNDIVHGNITDEHYAHQLVEDNFLFYYSPITDFRGVANKQKTEESLPRVMSSVGKNEVLRIKNIVNDLIQSLLNAMDKESRLWVESWLYKLTVSPRNLKLY
jgi:hypothetical protein